MTSFISKSRSPEVEYLTRDFFFVRSQISVLDSVISQILFLLDFRGFDVRPAVKEQVHSMGAEFLEVDIEEDGGTSGGYVFKNFL